MRTPGRGPRLERGDLARALHERAQAALAAGALEPIETERESIEDEGVRFVLRRVSSLARKPGAAARDDLFSRPEPDLLVGELSERHFALLNRYPVLERHLLIVTRAAVPQSSPLDRDDFAALAACLREVDGLGFYNGGREAGSSIDHKHLQLVPFPLGDGEDLPMERRFASGLPFTHALERVDPALFETLDTAGDQLAARHRALCDSLRLGAGPYNLLLTRRWLLLVPRACERFQGAPINALGFAGTLFVRDDAQREALRRAGPMAALRSVVRPESQGPG